jgi:hypothetical protein
MRRVQPHDGVQRRNHVHVFKPLHTLTPVPIGRCLRRGLFLPGRLGFYPFRDGGLFLGVRQDLGECNGLPALQPRFDGNPSPGLLVMRPSSML